MRLVVVWRWSPFVAQPSLKPMLSLNTRIVGMGCYTQLGIADSLDNPNPLKMKTLKGLEIEHSGIALAGHKYSASFLSSACRHHQFLPLFVGYFRAVG